MKPSIVIVLAVIGASLATGLQFTEPDLMKVNSTYDVAGLTFQVLASKDESLALDAVAIQYGEKKVSVPKVELADVAWPRLDKIEVTKELDSIYVTIPYGQELPEIKGYLTKVSYQFEKEVYVGRERVVPTKQVLSEEHVTTEFDHFRRSVGEDERPSGNGSVKTARSSFTDNREDNKQRK